MGLKDNDDFAFHILLGSLCINFAGDVWRTPCYIAWIYIAGGYEMSRSLLDLLQYSFLLESSFFLSTFPHFACCP